MKEEYSFDPMTGEKIVKKVEESQAEEVSFDPMTGEKIVKKVEEPKVEEEVSFDPMTGEKIVKKVTKPTAEETFSFDPMTGEKVYGNSYEEPIIQTAPVKSIGKGTTKVIGIVCAVLAVVLVAVAFISSGALLGKTDKVLLATYKTVKSVEFAEVETVADILLGQKYSISVVGDVMNQEIAATYSHSKKWNGLTMTADISGVGDIDGNVLMDDSTVKFNAPFLSDKVFVYDYVNEKDGALTELEDGEVTETLDCVLTAYRDGMNSKAAKNLKKKSLALVRDLKFEKVSKESYEVNGKNRSCAGYQTVLDEDFFKSYIDILEEYYTELYGDYDMDEMADMIEDELDALREEMEFDEEIELTCYLYKGKLAAVRMDVDGNVLELQINNTKNPIDKLTVCIESGDYEEEMEWECKKSGSKKEYTLDVPGLGDVLEISYDKKSGELSMEIEDDFLLEATVDSKGGVVTYAISELEVEGENLDVSCVFAVSKSADKVKLDGEVFDIGNASENDLEDLIEDMEDELEDVIEFLY